MSDNRQPSGLIYTSDYKIENLLIATSTGNSLDIRNIMISLDLYEDIFAPTMTGQIVLGDGADIISNFGLHGNEYIIIKLDKPSLGQPITKVFRIFKISDRRLGDNGLQNYTIHFCSEELILSTQILMSNAYKGMQISAIVNDILKNHLQVSSNKLANGIFESTTGNFDLIIPRMQPLEAICWLTPRAYNTNENLFFFYENRDGFNFTSFENLISKQLYATYLRIAKINNDPSQNMLGYNLLQVVQDFDILKSMRFGSYASSLYTMDTLARTLTTNVFGYNQVDKSKGLLNGNVPVNALQNRLGLTLVNSPASLLKMYTSIDSDSTGNPSKVSNWLPESTARLGQINSFKIIMSIPGDVMMKVGNVVGLNMPLSAPANKSGVQLDALRSGKYLVAAVHHQFRQDIMATIVELLSDSTNASLPDAQNSNTTVQQLVSW